MANLATRFIKFIASCLLGEHWNASIKDTQSQCGHLFENAQKSIRIVTGELQHELFEDDKVYSTLEELSTRKENPVTIEIIHGPNPDPKSKRIFKLAKEANRNVKIMRVPIRPKAHFILVDNSKFRIEKYHGPNQSERMAYMKTRKPIFLNNMLAEKFDELKAVSQKSP